MEANFNIPGDHYFINANLYRYLDNNTDAIPPVLVWEEDKSRLCIPYSFDDLIKSLEEGSKIDDICLSEIPDDVQRLLKLKRPDGPEDMEQQVTYHIYFER